MKNFGFGLMRLPMLQDKDNELDFPQICDMVDEFLKNGFTYFDTAHGYLGEKSEVVVRECLVNRHPRNSFLLADKLSAPYFNKEEDIRVIFEKQLEITGAKYFDYYLMHSLDDKSYKKFCDCNAFNVAAQLKKEGKIKKIAMSFHDSADVLDKILTQQNEIEAVQIQFNYADYDDAVVQSGAVYNVCRKHNKPIIIMEPVKGGGLVNNLPQNAKAVFDNLGKSAAECAIRYAASFEGVFMVLSGMSNLAQMKENLQFMKDFEPLNSAEEDAVHTVANILKKLDNVPCTACRYCVDGCPKKIAIPDLFACLNAKKQYKDWNSEYYYTIYTEKNGKASDCISCKKCEAICPQHIDIAHQMTEIATIFENKNN